MTDLVDLTEKRDHPANYLAADGWKVRTEAASEYAQSCQRPLIPLSSGIQLDNEFLTAHR